MLLRYILEAVFQEGNTCVHIALNVQPFFYDLFVSPIYHPLNMSGIALVSDLFIPFVDIEYDLTLASDKDHLESYYPV